MEAIECPICRRSTSFRTGKPFTSAMALMAHQKTCKTAQENGAQFGGPSNSAEKSIKSAQFSAESSASLSSSEEEVTSVVVNEKRESVPIATLWNRHKYCRDEDGRRVFNNRDHSIMAFGYKHGSPMQRAMYQGTVAALRSHVEEFGDEHPVKENVETIAKRMADEAEADRKQKAQQQADEWRALGYDVTAEDFLSGPRADESPPLSDDPFMVPQDRALKKATKQTGVSEAMLKQVRRLARLSRNLNNEGETKQ